MMLSPLLPRAAQGGAGLLAPLAKCARKTPQHDLWRDWQQKREYYPHRGNAPPWVPFSALDFTGRYVVSLMTLAVPKHSLFTTVSAHGMALVDTDPETHPVIIAMGYQEDVRQIIWPGAGAMNYLESIIAIPSVRPLNEDWEAKGPLILPLRLDVSELFPIMLGRLVGYPKVPADIKAPKHAYSVSAPFGGRPFLQASFQAYGEITTPRAVPNFQQTMEWMSRPFLTHTLLRSQIFTYLFWDFDNACIQPMEVHLEAGPDLPGMPAGCHTLAGYEVSKMGAARLILPWETAGPFDKSVIRPNPPMQPVKNHVYPAESRAPEASA
jgi:hypothetical protein